MFTDMVVNVAMARRQDELWFTAKGKNYWDTFVGDDGIPPGQATHGFPTNVTYKGHTGLTNTPNAWHSTSNIMFPWYMVKRFNQNPFYKEVSQNWLQGMSNNTSFNFLNKV